MLDVMPQTFRLYLFGPSFGDLHLLRLLINFTWNCLPVETILRLVVDPLYKDSVFYVCC